MKTLFFLSVFCITCILPAFSQCLDDQKSLLLGLRNSLTFGSSYSTKLRWWNHTKDCCNWGGVECDVFGHVISLQLDGEMITSGIDNSEYLFNLSYLEKLNLAFNGFNGIQIPKGLSNLANLTHLNLSYADFAGQVPREVLRLKKLVSLDLSAIVFPQLSASVSRRHVVSIFPVVPASYPTAFFGYDFPELPATVFPELSDPLHFKLKLENPNLKMLVQNLKALKELYLDSVNISAQGNDWFQAISSSLPDLRILSLRNCYLSGPIDSSLLELTSLSVLRLDYNDLASAVPDFSANFSRLTTLSLASCSLLGSFPQKIFQIPSLQNLDLSDNPLLSGSFPKFLRDGSLRTIVLSNTNFSGSLPDSIGNFPMLSKLDLSICNFFGQIPPTMWNLSELTYLDISRNNFTGSIPLFQLELFKNSSLEFLDLSHNDLCIQSMDSDSSLPLLLNILVLKLASCKLQRFPSLLRQSNLRELDLSSNELKGEIPNWIWEIGNGSLTYLDLSNNLLHGFQKPYEFPGLLYLNLHSNQFQGELPIPPGSSQVVDYSHNFFTNSIPNDIGFFLSGATFFSVSNNSLTGEIPQSICNASLLKVLDLSANALTGGIPPCLPNNSALGVLSLGRNNLSGTIPDTFSVNCSLKTLDLNKNVLKGKVPGTLVNCPSLEVFNIGNNRLEDTFPCMLMKTSLRILILRSNQFYGDLQCPEAIQELSNLQIIDISTNNMRGDISLLSFSNWRGMVSANDNKQSQSYQYLCFGYSEINGCGYLDAVTLYMKGLEMNLTKILTVFTSIDFSNNKFHGKIPHSIGDLKSLYGLNLSHNELTGSIPASIGNLTQLGSLDLSVNRLTGTIPVELASLTFIGFLNLSYNRLFGRIPDGQLQTFSAASFEGNVGLYGCPVDISCSKKGSGGSTPGFQNGEVHLKKEIDWDYVSAALGFAVAFGSTVWLTLHCKRWREMFFGKVDQIYLKFFRRC